MAENAIARQVQEAINAGTLAQFIRENLEGKNLSIAGVAALCSVADKSIINGGSFNSARLAEKLEAKGFEAGSLVEGGFDSIATWLTIEYFAYESKAKAVFAKAIARTFGAFGVKAAFDEVLGAPTKSDNRLPGRTLTEIDQAAEIITKHIGPHAGQSLLIINMRRHYPDIALPEIVAQERASLPSAEALLTATQIAEELGITCKTNSNPSPQGANNLLKELGYQYKVSKQWTPTEKGEPFCDRKPIDTNSKSDKFQLLWRASIIDEVRGQGMEAAA